MSVLHRLPAAVLAIALGGLGCTANDGPDTPADADTGDTDTDTDTGTDADTDTSLDGGSDTGELPPESSDAIFDPEHLVEITIDLPPADWDALRQQTRAWDVLFGEGCQDQPFAKPFTYFPAQVTIDGITQGEVGVRKKGFLGSLDDTKPSLKLDFQEYVPDVTLHGVKRMTLNNARQDPALIRQCLTYQMFASAGLVSSRCNFAHVTVNGEDLGVYANIEPVKKPMLARHFESDDGNLYEGTLSDFREGWMNTFEQKTNKDEPSMAGIEALAQILEGPDDGLVDTLSAELDVDQFIDYWVMEVLTGHWDGYASNTNNYFLYRDPAQDRFVFLPWGVDGVLSETAPPYSLLVNGVLTRRLWALDDIREQYRSRMRALLDQVWDEDALLAEIDRMEALLLPVPGYAFDEDLSGAIDEVRGFITERRAQIEPELDAPAPTVDGEAADSFCLIPTGAADIEFDTTWDTLDPPDPFSVGSATIAADYEGQALVIQAAGSQIGPTSSPEEGEQIELQILGLLDDGNIVVYVFFLPPASLAESTYSVGFDEVFGVAVLVDPDAGGQDYTVIGNLFGDLAFDQASIGAGQPVSGTFMGDVLNFGG